MAEFRYKQVIILRIDLGMSKGKIAAQAGHAAVSSAEKARKSHPEFWRAWIEEGQRKVALRAQDEKKLFDLEKKAVELRLPYAMIIDKGLTELPAGTMTCLGIGPGPSKQVDKITGNLKLL